jgi:hypothetical protein
MDLLALDEIRRRLRIVGQSYLGVREVPVAQIIGHWVATRTSIAASVTDVAKDFDDAARDARSQRVSRGFRRAFLREKGRPLRRRA